MNLKAILSVALLLLFLNLLILIFPGINNINGSTTQDTVSLSFNVIASQINATTNASETVNFSKPAVIEVVSRIDGLTPGQNASIYLLGKGFPSSWTETEPTVSEVGDTKFEYLEITVNNATSGGSYTIYFNLSQSDLGDVAPADIRLFVYDSGWDELSTTVINGTSDPASFFGTTTHFSKFLIAEKAASGSPGGGDSGSPGGGSGGGSGGSSGASIIDKALEILDDEEEKPSPVFISGDFFDVSVTIPEKYQELLNSEELLAEIRITNIRKIGPVSVNIEYNIEDLEKRILFKEYETKIVENDITYLKSTILPAGMNPGYHMYLVKLSYGEDNAFAGYPFKIVLTEQKSAVLGQLKSVSSFFSGNLAFFAIIFVLILAFLVLMVNLNHKKREDMLRLLTTNQLGVNGSEKAGAAQSYAQSSDIFNPRSNKKANMGRKNKKRNNSSFSKSYDKIKRQILKDPFKKLK